MARVILTYVGEVNGVKAYAPMDAEDEKVINGQNTIVADVKGERAKRTELQRRAKYLYFTMLADALNAAGLDMKVVMEKLSKKAMIPWSQSAVLERLWRPTQEATYGTKSTTELNTDQVGPTYEALNLVTSERLGVSVPFPDRYNQMIEQIGK